MSFIFFKMLSSIFFFILDPGPMNPPNFDMIHTTYVVIIWSPPQDPNGIIISFNIELEPLRFDENPFVSSRLGREGVLACYQFLGLKYSSKFTAFDVLLNTTIGKCYSVSFIVFHYQ